MTRCKACGSRNGGVGRHRSKSKNCPKKFCKICGAYTVCGSWQCDPCCRKILLEFLEQNGRRISREQEEFSFHGCKIYGLPRLGWWIDY